MTAKKNNDLDAARAAVVESGKHMGSGDVPSAPVLRLPLPPSANRLWRSSRGRVYRSPGYMAWLDEAGWLLKAQRPAKGVGDLCPTGHAAGHHARLPGLTIALPNTFLAILGLASIANQPSRLIHRTAYTDPYVRWCERGGAARLPPISIVALGYLPWRNTDCPQFSFLRNGA
jgi:hypothetical protein